jgi:hypothetical protein
MVVCTCIHSEWGIRIVVCTCIHREWGPPFTVDTWTYNYTDSPIHCVYMYTQPYGYPHSLCIHVTYKDSEWGNPHSCIYMYKQWMGESAWLYVHVYTVNEGIRIVVYTCIHSVWGIRCTYNYTDSPIHCLYMYIQLCGFPHSLSIHVHTTIRIPPSPFIQSCIHREWENPNSCMYMYKQWMGESV